MVRQFLTDVMWPELDYLLVDTPPGTSDEHISLAESLLQQTSASSPKLAGAVIVTTPQAVAVSDVRKELSFCRKVGIGVLGVVENMSGYVCECCGEGTDLFGKGGGKEMAEQFGVRFLGGVPVDGQWGVLVEEGRRPRYGEDAVRDEGGGESDEDDDEDEEGGASGQEERNEANGHNEDAGHKSPVDGQKDELLVDKYQSCSLCSIFEGFTKQLTDIVDKSHAKGP